MKKLLFSLVIAAAAITANATVRTVNNGTVSAGQYTTVQAAVDVSKAGDTIYIHGSQTTYGDVTLNKRLVLLGAGHNLTGTQFNFRTRLNYIYFSQGNSTTLPTGSTIKGISSYGVYGSGGSLPVNNITLERNYFDGGGGPTYVLGTGWICRNNFMSYISINNFKNTIISNNVITNRITASNQPSVIITNNIFLNSAYFGSISYATVTNNIFLNPAYQNFSGTQNTWNKNIMIYSDPANYKTFPPANNTGVGNLNTVDEQFTTTIPLDISLANAPKQDWILATTSIGFKYGTDGTDVGIYGGSYPMPNLTGAPNIPQITSMDIQNSVIPQNGTLSIELKARGQK
jgi:hypothetical protein